MIYDNLKKNTKNILEVKNKVNINFVRGPFVEISGPKQAQYRVQFIDNASGITLYESTVSNNCWSKCRIDQTLANLAATSVSLWTHLALPPPGSAAELVKIRVKI